MATTDEETPLVPLAAAAPPKPRAKRQSKGGIAFIAIVAFAIGFFGVVALKATHVGTGMAFDIDENAPVPKEDAALAARAEEDMKIDGEVMMGGGG